MTLSKSLFSTLGLLGLVFVLSGCSSLSMLPSGKMEVPPASEQENAQGMYLVDIHPSFAKKTSYKGQLRPGMTVQNALEESGAFGKVKGMEVDLYRIVEGKGRTLKMPVELQKGKRVVRFEQDYAVHPGDRIVVKAKSSALDGVLNRLGGSE